VEAASEGGNALDSRQTGDHCGEGHNQSELVSREEDPGDAGSD